MCRTVLWKKGTEVHQQNPTECFLRTGWVFDPRTVGDSACPVRTELQLHHRVPICVIYKDTFLNFKGTTDLIVTKQIRLNTREFWNSLMGAAIAVEPVDPQLSTASFSSQSPLWKCTNADTYVPRAQVWKALETIPRWLIWILQSLQKFSRITHL
jgi:hypothetical protein